MDQRLSVCETQPSLLVIWGPSSSRASPAPLISGPSRLTRPRHITPKRRTSLGAEAGAAPSSTAASPQARQKFLPGPTGLSAGGLPALLQPRPQRQVSVPPPSPPPPSHPPPPPGHFFRVKKVTLFFSSSTSVNIEKRALASQARQPRREGHFNINEIV